MRLDIGLPMHNAAECVIQAVEHLADAMEALHDPLWALQIVDDWSDPDELAKVREHIFHNPETSPRLRYACSIVRSQDLWSTSPAPNLGRILNHSLAGVSGYSDYYLNLESDVYLQPDTLRYLIEAIKETGAPMACPKQRTPDGDLDFIFWGAGIIRVNSFFERHSVLRVQQRPKWCNLGCLLVRGDVARDLRCRVDTQFNLFCVDQDYTSTVAQVHGRPVYEPKAVVTHVGRQSTKEGQPGGHTAHDAVRRINDKWAGYLSGGLFGP